MIRRLRFQVVAVCMLMVTAVLSGVFLSLYTSARQGIEESSEELLRRVVARDPRINREQSSLQIGGNQVQLPFFVVEIWGDTAYVTGGTYSDLENTEVLATILRLCAAQNAETGSIPEYDLRYLRQYNGMFERVAFVDVSLGAASLKTMIHSSLRIGGATLALFLVLSVLLARWVTRPVERAWSQQRQFLSDASHELKTPLTVILSNAEMMASSPLEPPQARWVDNVCSAARQMRALVEEMLTLARADSMVRTCVLTPLSLSDLATDCALLFEPVAYEAGKQLRYEQIDPEVFVRADGDKLKQLLSILLDNALKYSPAGTAVELSLKKQERAARIQVSNQGPPIPPEQLRRLFERFYRADASRGRQAGFGLGLSIAQTIAAEHKGSLRAESDQTSTRFSLTLPLERS